MTNIDKYKNIPDFSLNRKKQPIIPLIYDNTINTENIQNILLIDSSITEEELFYISANKNTYPIKYSNNSDKTELLILLKEKFSNGISRIGFIFHDPGPGLKTFLNNTVLFNDDDLIENQTSFSENVTFLETLVKQFNITNFDFLACNTLKYTRWNAYYELLTKLTGVICGASNDKTGNIKYGNNWVLENTMQDIKNIYFNDSINNYSESLEATTLSQAGGNIDIQFVNSFLQYKYSGGNWTNITAFPINIQNTLTDGTILTINLLTNLTIGLSDGYLVCTSSYITFDGKGNTCTINGVSNYPGLIKSNTANNNSPGFQAIIVKNINISSINSTLRYYAGWVCQSDFGKNGTSTITNCSNSSAVSNYGGGICGNAVASNNGTINIINCSNSGTIKLEGGGICGKDAGTNGTVTITNCSNSGVIEIDGGGICGPFAGTYGTINITNCSNSGEIRISGGGICAFQAGRTGTATITKSFNIGNITGNHAGGIVGFQFGIDTNNTCSITKCYNIGNITGNQSGGICGPEIGYVNFSSRPIINISECYSLGSVSSTSGGLLGGTFGTTYAFNPTIRLNNCYTNGSLVNTGSQFISNNLQIKSIITVNNCYFPTSVWNDNEANQTLINTPSAINPGITWTAYNTNVPYVLTAFNSSIYNPDIINSATIIQTPYNSSNGLFVSPLNDLFPYTYRQIYTIIYDRTMHQMYTGSDITITINTGSITFANNVINYTTTYDVYVFVARYGAHGYPYNYNVNKLTVSPVSCFNKDTKILCLNKQMQEEYIKIQDLRSGDLVKTYLHGYRKIDCIGKNDMCNDPSSLYNCMYILEKTEENNLIDDLILTGGHAVLVDELTEYELQESKNKFTFNQVIDNKKLLMACISKDFKPLQNNDKYTYYHFILENDGDDNKRFGVWANGVLAEISSKNIFKKHPYEIIN